MVRVSTWRNRTDCMLSVNISVSGHQMDVKSSVAREMKLMAVNGITHIHSFMRMTVVSMDMRFEDEDFRDGK